MFWKRFDKHKPTKNGWYQCTISFEFGDSVHQTYVMDLYWDNSTQKFRDNRRQNVFDTYDVYGYKNGNKREKLFTSNLCDRTDTVVAWKNLPKPYKLKGRKYVK